MLPQYSFSSAPTIDWLIVPSGANYRTDMENETLVAWIRATGRRAQVARKVATGLVIDWDARRAGYRAAAVDSGS